MPVTMSGLSAGSAVAVVSVLAELGSALHVLNDPSHHRATEWADRVGGSLSSALADETRAWAWTSRAIRAMPFLVVDDDPEDLGVQLDRMRDRPEELAESLLRPIARSNDPTIARRWAGSRERVAAELIAALCDRQAAVAERFVDFLARTWHEWFAQEWEGIRPQLVKQARQFNAVVERMGVAAALTGLSSSVRVSDDGHTLTIDKVANRRHDLSRRRLVVVPSVYIHPHLYVGDVPGGPLVLVAPASTRSKREIPSAAQLRDRLDALANPGRLEVARAIATESRSAEEIGGLWGKHPTQVNKHLRALAAAGLARSERRGRFVRYSLDSEAVASLGTDLAALLRR